MAHPSQPQRLNLGCASPQPGPPPSFPPTPIEQPEFQTEWARQLFLNPADPSCSPCPAPRPARTANSNSSSTSTGIVAVTTAAAAANFNSNTHANSNTNPNSNSNSNSNTQLKSNNTHSNSNSSANFNTIPSSSTPAFDHPNSDPPTSNVSFAPPHSSFQPCPSLSPPQPSFRHTLRKKVDGFKDGISFLKPSRAPLEADINPSSSRRLLPFHRAPSTDSLHLAPSVDCFPPRFMAPSLLPSSLHNLRNGLPPSPVSRNTPLSHSSARPLSRAMSLRNFSSASFSSAARPSLSSLHHRPLSSQEPSSPCLQPRSAFSLTRRLNSLKSEPRMEKLANGTLAGENHPPSGLFPPKKTQRFLPSHRLRAGRVPFQSLDIQLSASTPSHPDRTLSSELPDRASPSSHVSHPLLPDRPASCLAAYSPTAPALDSHQEPDDPPPHHSHHPPGPSPPMFSLHHDPPGPLLGWAPSREVRGPSVHSSDTRASARPASKPRSPSQSSISGSGNLPNGSSAHSTLTSHPSLSFQPPPPPSRLGLHNLHHRSGFPNQEIATTDSNHTLSRHASAGAHPPPPDQLGGANRFKTPCLRHKTSATVLPPTTYSRQRAEQGAPVPCLGAKLSASLLDSSDEASDDEELNETPAPGSGYPPHQPSPKQRLRLQSSQSHQQRKFYVREDHDALLNPPYQEQLFFNALSHLRFQQQQEQQQQQKLQAQETNKVDKNVIRVNSVEYQKQCVIGKGGSSKVYRASPKESPHELVAIKVVGLRSSDVSTFQTFCNEVELLKKLRGHDRIINLVDSFIDHERFKVWLVMELGEIDLNQLLNRQMNSSRFKGISLRFIKHIWEQMLEAVHAVHEAGIIHTDLKPANFVLVQGSVKIIDFGIAKAVPADTTNISRETQIGTANYMSPEALMIQIDPQRKTQLVKMGRGTDIWALGCILYQMVYGHTPFAKLEGSLKINTIRDPNHSIDYPNLVMMVGHQRQGQPAHPPSSSPELSTGSSSGPSPPAQGQQQQHQKIGNVDGMVIETMKRCLKYRKEERWSIPALLEDEFLVGALKCECGKKNGEQSKNEEDGVSSNKKVELDEKSFEEVIMKSMDWYHRKLAVAQQQKSGTVSGEGSVGSGRAGLVPVNENTKRKFARALKDSILLNQ